MGNHHNIIWHQSHVSRRDRNRLNKHDSGIIWLTGLSASGKSTIAHHLEKHLHEAGIRAYVFDGDNIRHGLNVNLGFSDRDRRENTRRIVEVAKLFVDAGVVVLASFITPYREQRDFIRNQCSGLKYVEIYVKCSIEECIQRDPKGQYKKALNGIIKHYTGVSSPFEEPESPDLILDTEILNVEESVETVFNYLWQKNFLGLDP